MNRDEFIGKLQMVYVGDRNAFNEIVEDNQKLKNEVVYSKVEIDRLKNIINELEKELREGSFDVYFCSTNTQKTFKSNEIIIKSLILDKLKELKENNK